MNADELVNSFLAPAQRKLVDAMKQINFAEQRSAGETDFSQVQALLKKTQQALSDTVNDLRTEEDENRRVR